MEVIWTFLADNWIVASAALVSLVLAFAVPAFRGVILKALKAALTKLAEAFLAMFTAELLIRVIVWGLRRLVKLTKGDLDDRLVEEWVKKLEK
jgi:hypothetical protein